MAIFIVRTTAGRERQVVDKLEVIGKKNQNIMTILSPPGIRGYIFVEARSRDEVVSAVYGLGHAKGVIQEPIPIEKVEHFLISAPQKISIKENDLVELISGPFKGEKAKVTRVATDKEEVVVALLDTSVPIPMKVSVDSVRVIASEEKDETEREIGFKEETKALRKEEKPEEKKKPSDDFDEAF